ncbi:ATPase, T2SS/T4P/T4SS family [Marinobacterium arenosum]|uniref:ATPase, T2SS/T4P/T4SS family n=1 Tax=Marinobacterium arenosum TaxID=2862496 RepID=UPI001C9554EA|nr:ATPase, T2SS/T4P/T4SS family [Marinobacterium arenosum]MBY4677950.1 Flp pilus assembly complex ATPase component TadA [Marinobacterium arenosum]
MTNFFAPVANLGQQQLTATASGYQAPDGAHRLLPEMLSVFDVVSLAKWLSVSSRQLPPLKDFLIMLDKDNVVRIFGIRDKDEKGYESAGLALAEFIRGLGKQARTEWLGPNTFRDLNTLKTEISAPSGDDDSPDIARLYVSILKRAVQLNASDIHIIMINGFAYLQFRVNGQLVTDAQPRTAEAIRALCRHVYHHRADNTGSHWEPHIGANCVDSVEIEGVMTQWRFHSWPNEDRKHAHVVFRRNSIPNKASFLDISHWEDYSETKLIGELRCLGYAEQHCHQLLRMFSAPSGGIFIGGKTCSGKTTLLDTVLSGVVALSDFQRLTICVEDVPELNIPRAIRTPVNLDIEGGYGFSDAIKSALRRNADICVVGEIRDADSGPAVERGILTDHLVPASVHVNDLLSMFDRLDDLGVSRAFLSSSRRAAGFIWQKLLPTLCDHCKQPVDPHSAIAGRLLDRGLSLDGIYTRNRSGCEKCQGIPPGRIVAAEIMDAPNAAMRRAIAERDEQRLLELWQQRAKDRQDPVGVRALDHALEHVKAGRVCPLVVEAELQRLDMDDL